MKTFFVLAVILMGGLLYLHQSFEDGAVLRYIDAHPMDQGVPKATYCIGQTYFLFQDLTQAATYFLRVAERYPTLPMADDAYFNYMQSLEDNVSIPKGHLIEGYKTYLEKFPEGQHVGAVKDRLSTYSSGGVNP